MEQHLVEGADTAAQLLLLSDAPSDEQWAGGRERKNKRLFIVFVSMTILLTSNHL